MICFSFIDLFAISGGFLPIASAFNIQTSSYYATSRHQIYTPINRNIYIKQQIYYTPLLSSSLPTPIEPQEQTLEDYLPPEHPLHEVLKATSDACIPKPLEKVEGSSKPTEFRYEWGTWCSKDKLDTVSKLLSEIRLITGAYEDLMDRKGEIVEQSIATLDGNNNDEEVDKSGVKEIGRRIRISTSKFYDVILYILPKGARCEFYVHMMCAICLIIKMCNGTHKIKRSDMIYVIKCVRVICTKCIIY